MEARLDRHALVGFDPTWATVVVTPPGGYGPGQVGRRSVRLQGLIPADTLGSAGIGDADGDATPDIALRFRRAVLPSVVTTGDTVFVAVAGVMDSAANAPSLRFTGRDTVRVRRPNLTAPVAGQNVTTANFLVQWNVVPGIAKAVVLRTMNGGATWTVVADSVANTGSYSWTTPTSSADSVRLAVIQIEARPGASVVDGPLALSGWFTVTRTTDIEPALPAFLSLAPVQPTPSRGNATLRFGLPHAGPVRLALYDIAGREVAVLADGPREAGWHTIEWHGAARGHQLGAGLYFARLTAGSESRIQRLVWVR
jgi:hypothetical protein